ncbi:hypothetical protein V8C86DRAFT_2507729 [Haematococcus lacustris]
MEDNIPRIVSETCRLVRELDSKSQVEPALIAYMACFQEVRGAIDVVAPGATLTSKMEPAQVSAVSQLLSKLLTEKDSPVLAATRMQVSMEAVFRQQRQIVEQEQAERAERVAMAARAVTTHVPGRDASAAVQDKTYSRVLEYVCLASSMDTALSEGPAKEEVRAALGSVFPLSSLAHFLSLTAAERQVQVEELARITLGVCLYNRNVGRGGLALPPGTSGYAPQAGRLQRDIQRHIAELSAEVDGCAALMRLATPQEHQATPRPSQDGAADIETRNRAQAEAIHKAQCLVLYEDLASDLRSGLEAVASLDGELQHLLAQVTDAVGGSSAVAKDRVFPMFDRLGALHQALMEELRLLVVRQRLADDLASLTGGYVTLLQRMAKTRRPGRKTAVEEELSRMAAAADAALQAGAGRQAPPGGSEDWTWHPPPAGLQAGSSSMPGKSSSHASNQGSGSATPLSSTGASQGMAAEAQALAPAAMGGWGTMALNGFDPVLLVKQGQLRRADLRLGTLQRGQEQAFGFATHDSLTDFAANPEAAVAGVEALIAKLPVLARLLHRAAAYPVLNIHLLLDIVSRPLKVDFGSQTPLHFTERHIDYSYEWNEWALRRRALAIANLRNKRTHSTQTGLSHFKRDAEAQVWQPKEAQVQTRVAKGQSMPKKLQYVTGLRGAPDVKMKVVRLELELGQPHQF